MPEERDIEKLLRAYGKQRKEKAPEELHPATRRLLLDEIRRKYPQDGARSASAPWFGWWKQMAWMGGLCGALALTVYVVAFRDSHSTDLAKAEPPPAAATELELAKAEPTTAPVAEAPALQNSRDSQLDQPRSLNEALFKAVPAPAVPPTPEVPAVPAQAAPPVVAQSDEYRVALKMEGLALADSKAFAVSPPATAPPATIPPIATEPALSIAPLQTPARGVVTLREEVGQKSTELASSTVREEKQLGRIDSIALFTNQAEDKKLDGTLSRSRRAASVTAPLQSFRFVQSSNGVQLIDLDGSVYNGAFDANTPALLARSVAATRPEPAATAPAVRTFQVMGTNATSGQRITVRGVAQFDAALSSVRLQVAPAAAPSSQAAARAKMDLPMRVEAKATLDDGRQLDIRAVRVDR